MLHDREYRVRAFRLSADRLLIRGAVRDQKPPNLYIVDDDQPLTIHHMQIDLEVGFPSLEIVAAAVRFETHPHGGCPAIIDHYGGLVGLSIARGFTHKVRELFGGPRGCTHTTALLQAMAPVAVQCFWSMDAADARHGTGVERSDVPRSAPRRWSTNLNTCHVWAEDGELVTTSKPAATSGSPIFIAKRAAELGLERMTSGSGCTVMGCRVVNDPFGLRSLGIDQARARPGAKWQFHPAEYAAWVADMDFPIAPVDPRPVDRGGVRPMWAIRSGAASAAPRRP